jgi:uncharacterized membrane protein
MKTDDRFSFIKTTIVGGLIFLVPIIVLAIIFGKALGITRKIVGPLTDLIGVETVAGVGVATLLGILVIVLFCFLAGLLAKTDLAKKIINWLEATFLSNIPGYTFMKSMGESFASTDMAHGYAVVLARFDDGWQIAFLVEHIGNGHVAVFIPGAPSPWSGSVYFMTEDRIKTLDVPHKAVLKCIQRLGAGSNSLLKGRI